MRALVYDGEALRVRKDYPRPVPSPGEALVRVRLAGICNTDLEIVRGYMGFRGVLGHEFVGTVEEAEAAFGPENLCLPREEIERRIDRYLRFVGLAEMRRREPASLSGGQKQRLAIASVLALEPLVLVMDEPTTDLDPVGREEVLSVSDLLRQERRTLVVVDQDPDTAVDADQVWLMREGEIVAQGPSRQVLTDLALLEPCGVQPPPTVALFQALGWPGQPLTVDEAIALIQQHHLARPRPLQAPAAPTNGRPIILELRDVDYVYPTRAVEALKGVNLQIREGEFLALVGQNGSGKTTLAKHLNGLLKPTRGEGLFRGRPLGEIRRTEMARHVGYVFQNPDHQIFSNTVREEVGFSPKIAGLDEQTIKERVAEALEVMGLSGYEEEVPFTLTKGERQRVAVASVLAAQPPVIILIVQAQISRGLDLESGNIFQRAGKFIPLGVPLFIYAVRHTNMLAMALESKGFNPGAPRTWYYNPKMRRADVVALAVLTVLFLAALSLRLQGYGQVLPRL